MVTDAREDKCRDCMRKRTGRKVWGGGRAGGGGGG